MDDLNWSGSQSVLNWGSLKMSEREIKEAPSQSYIGDGNGKF